MNITLTVYDDGFWAAKVGGKPRPSQDFTEGGPFGSDPCTTVFVGPI